MKEYKVEATVKLRSVGFFEAESKEEAEEKFRLESLKVDYNASSLGHSISGWNPIVTEVENAEV